MYCIDYVCGCRNYRYCFSLKFAFNKVGIKKLVTKKVTRHKQ